MKSGTWGETCGRLFWTVVLAVGLSSAVVALGGASPLEAYRHILAGSLGSWAKFAQVLRVWVPLTLCSLGLLFTFQIGLWNIGVEGQVVLGAVGATAVVRWGGGAAPELVLPAALVGAALCGGLWALAAGILKTRGGVNEIFAGLGLNFVASGLLLYLIFGPWKQPGIASMSGTETFPQAYWFPGVPGWAVSPYAVAATVVVLGFTAWSLRGTRVGLALKAIGRNPHASYLLGLSPSRWMLLAMLLAGSCAGLAGAYQALAVYHRLIPNISSQYGYLALLVVMLAHERWQLIPWIALFFAVLNVGSIQLPMMLRMDSSLAGVLQGSLVLAALAVQGVSSRRRRSS